MLPGWSAGVPVFAGPGRVLVRGGEVRSYLPTVARSAAAGEHRSMRRTQRSGSAASAAPAPMNVSRASVRRSVAFSGGVATAM